MKFIYSLAAASVIFGAGSTALVAAEAKDGVSYKIQDRLRYESVTQNNALDDATALTNRLLLGINYKSGDLSLDAEVVNVSALIDDYYDNDGTNTGNFSTVVDPEQTRLTQAKLTYKADKTTMIAGRQMINIDNQRFVGAVDWRQMFQTFDALVVANSSVKNLGLTAAYVAGVNGINADKTSGGTDGAWKTKSAVVHAKYKASDDMTFTAYGYLLGSVHDTYGLSLAGKADKVKYHLEYAIQADASLELSATADVDTPASGPATADASYMNVDIAYELDKTMTVGVNYEVLSGTDGTGTATAFSTPLATGHKFNGWADIFLNTPANGLVDTNGRFVYKTKEAGKFVACYHMFAADIGGADYGTELDILYTNKIASVKGLSYLVKYADYAADTNGVDTTKMWASLDYKFDAK